MSPQKPKKPSLWRGFVSFAARPGPSQGNNSGVPNIFDDREANAKVLQDLSRPHVKRRRTFTGFIKVSDAGMPKNDAMLSNAMKLGILLFIVVDICLVLFFLHIF